MATAPTAGKIYLVESDSDDWITDHAGDPDLIDFDSFTNEGVDWCQFSFPMRMIKRGKTGITVVASGAAKTSESRNMARFYNAIVMGKTSSRANAHLIGKFLMSNRHTSGASATFKRYYLVIYYGTNDHEPFTDASDSRLSYAPGVVSDWEIQWSEPKHINMDVRINWWSVF